MNTGGFKRSHNLLTIYGLFILLDIVNKIKVDKMNKLAGTEAHIFCLRSGIISYSYFEA